MSRSELKSYRTTYNALPDDVDAAYERFQSTRTRLRTIRRALRIINRHGADDILGLFLLHRHFNCPAGMIFVERKYTPRKKHPPVLVTKAEPAAKAPRRLSPHRFAFGRGGNLQSLEFTTDRFVTSACRRLAGQGELRKELFEHFSRNNMLSTLGLGIFVRSVMLEKATSVFVEETFFEDRASIVHILPRLPRGVGRAIPTLWTFSENAYGCCSGRCVAYCSNHTGVGYCGHRKTGSHLVCV